MNTLSYFKLIQQNILLTQAVYDLTRKVDQLSHIVGTPQSYCYYAYLLDSTLHTIYHNLESPMVVVQCFIERDINYKPTLVLPKEIQFFYNSVDISLPTSGNYIILFHKQ